MNRKISVNLALAIAIIAVAVTFSVTMIFSQSLFEDTVTSVREKEEMYNKIAEVDKTVREDSYYQIDDAFLFDMLATGYMAGVQDPYARYYTVSQYANYLSITQGTDVGIGVSIYKASGQYPVIDYVFAQSPAMELGLVIGNSLRQIDSIDLQNLSEEQIMGLLYGAEGSTMELTYATISGEVLEPVTLQRRVYEEPTIQATHRENEVVGYITIMDFKEGTAQEIEDAIDAMEQSAQGLSALVIDVRNNSGGAQLSYALNAIDTIATAGTMGYQLDNAGNETLLGISDNTNSVDVPIVVVVNENTNAGAELFALALREINGAQIVGTSTAGKASVQNAPILLDDGSAINYTIGVLVSGERTEFNTVGVAPNVEVLLREEDQATPYFLTIDTDLQILRARELVLSMMAQNSASEGPRQEEQTQTEQDSEITLEENVDQTQEVPTDGDGEPIFDESDSETDTTEDSETDTTEEDEADTTEESEADTSEETGDE